MGVTDGCIRPESFDWQRTAALDIKGAWASFENVGWASGYANGDVLKSFDSIQSQIAQQMDLMRGIGINAITFPIVATDATYNRQLDAAGLQRAARAGSTMAAGGDWSEFGHAPGSERSRGPTSPG